MFEQMAETLKKLGVTDQLPETLAKERQFNEACESLWRTAWGSYAAELVEKIVQPVVLRLPTAEQEKLKNAPENIVRQLEKAIASVVPPAPDKEFIEALQESLATQLKLQ